MFFILIKSIFKLVYLPKVKLKNILKHKFGSSNRNVKFMTLTSRTRQILDRVPRQLNKKFVKKIKK